MKLLMVAIFAVYIITVVTTSSSLLANARAWLIRRTPRLQPIQDYPHFIECRLCVGFWISLAVTPALGLSWTDGLLVYGASYFLATQER